MSSCESLIVSTTTGVSMPSARSRVSSRWPSTGAIRRSMIARSGRSSRSRRTASSASPVLPTTLMPARASSSSDEAAAAQAMIVDEDDANLFGHCEASSKGADAGKVSVSRVPVPPERPSAILPPRRRARSRMIAMP